MTSKHVAKIIDPKDLNPAWKILQMKIKEEESDKKKNLASSTEKNERSLTKTKTQIKKENRKRRAEKALAEANEASAAKKKFHDIPVLIEDNEIGELTKVVAIDCEYVGAGMNGSNDVLARVSIVNDKGKIIYNKYVKPTEAVTDYRTSVSGIRPEHLLKGISFQKVQHEVSKILEERIVVGHAIHNDFRVLQLKHSRKLTRDTAKCSVLKSRVDQKRGVPSLKKLAKEILGIEIQQGEHDSITDARVALRLYEAVKKQWEAEIKRFRS